MFTSSHVRARSRASIADFTAWALFALLLLAVAMPAAAQSYAARIDLELTKTVDRQYAAVGDDVVYTIRVTNKPFYGSAAKATNIYVKDYLPSGLTALAYSATTGGQHGIQYDHNTLTWRIEWLNAGQSVDLQFKARVNREGEFKNCAEIWDADQKDIDSLTGAQAYGPLAGLASGEDDEDCAEFWAVSNGSISGMVFEDVDGNGLFDNYEGGLGGFEVDLNKIGNDHACGTYDDQEIASVDSDYNGNYTFDDVPAGTYCVEIDDIQIPVGFQRTTANPVKVTVAAGEDVTGVKFGFQSPRIDLELTKVVDNENPTVGDKVTFTLTLKNNTIDHYGQTVPTQTATGIQVKDYLPAGLAFHNANEPQYTSFNANDLTWYINQLEAGKSISLVLEAIVTHEGELENCAEVWDAHQRDRDSRTGAEAYGQLVGGPDAEDDQDCASLWARPRTIDLELVKTVDDAYPTVGDKVTFTLTLTNQDHYGTVETATATGIQVKDYLPEGLTLHSASEGPGVSFDEYNTTWHIDQLEAGKSVSLILEALVSTDGEFTNCAEVWDDYEKDRDSHTGAEAGAVLLGGPGAEDDQDCASLWATPRTIDLELTKTVDNAYPSVGDKVAFTITLTNQDHYGTVETATATGIQVKDYLPHGLGFHTAHTPNGTTFDANTTTWHVPQLEAGKSLSLVIEAVVSTDGEFTNCAEVWDAYEVDRDSHTGDQAGGVLVGDEDDQDCASLWASPVFIDLEVTKTIAEDYLTVGDTAEFTIVVTNNDQVHYEPTRTAKATGVVIADYLPEGFWLIEGSADYAGSTVHFDESITSWHIEWIKPGESVTLKLKARAERAGEFENCAEVWDADQKDRDSKTGAEAGGRLVGDEDDQDCVPFWVAEKLIDLEVTKTIAEDNLTVGDVAEFTIVVTNNDVEHYEQVPTAKATNVMVADYLPEGFWLVEGSTHYAASGVTFDENETKWVIEWIEPGQSVTLKLKARAERAGEFQNCAEVWDADQKDRDSLTGDEAGGRLVGDEDDQDCVEFWVAEQLIDLELTKSISDANPKLGDTVTFTIVVTNNDVEHYETVPTAKATNVVVKDYLPGGLWVLEGSSPQAATNGVTFDKPSATFDIEWIAAGQSVTLKIKARVDEKGEFTNAAEVWDADQKDRDSQTGAEAGAPLAGPYEDDQDSVTYWVQGPAVSYKGHVSGVVFNDLDYDGVRDSGEPGLYGFEVDLTTLGNDYRCGGGDDVELATIDTDYEGKYGFWDLEVGTYCVRILDAAIPQGFQRTSPDPVKVEVTAGGTAVANFGYKTSHTPPPPPPPHGGELCYLVADNDGDGYDSADVLTSLSAGDYADVVIGKTHTDMIEAIAFNPWTEKLFASDARRLGTLDLYTGKFTAIGEYGGGEGEEGWISFLDVDGLSFNPFTEELYGSVRRVGKRDLLIQIDPTTGKAVKDAFGYGIDYLVIKPESGYYGSNELDDLDDLAWDPETGDLYAINNHDGMDSRLVIINPTPSGAWITKVLELPVGNVEGLAFFNDGTLYGSAGEGDEAIVQIDKNSLQVTVHASLGTNGNRDYEGIDCLTAAPSYLRVAAFDDMNGDGAMQAYETSHEGMSVHLYRDMDADGTISSPDRLLDTETVSADGTATFSAAAIGAFLIQVGDAETGMLGVLPAMVDNYGLNLEGSMHGSMATSTANDADTDLPAGFELTGNYPNPFNPETTIRFSMPESAQVRLSVHDVLGREIAVLVDGVIQAGSHDIKFAAGDLPSGTYMARLAGSHGVQTRTMVLLK